MVEEIYNIIEKYDGDGDADECIGEIEDMLSAEESVTSFKVEIDNDVFDSPGLDVYYISVAWVDDSDELHLCGSSLTRC